MKSRVPLEIARRNHFQPSTSIRKIFFSYIEPSSGKEQLSLVSIRVCLFFSSFLSLTLASHLILIIPNATWTRESPKKKCVRFYVPENDGEKTWWSYELWNLIKCALGRFESPQKPQNKLSRRLLLLPFISFYSLTWRDTFFFARVWLNKPFNILTCM